jgi:hypothetical protein
MPHARYEPPDHSKGDESTIGGYTAVHARPAAFQGSDGFSYSVELMTEPVDTPGGAWAAFFLFIRWSRLGGQSPEGHLETDYLLTADSEPEARSALGETPLAEVKALLDRLIAARGGGAPPPRRWWDAMRDDDESSGGEPA